MAGYKLHWHPSSRVLALSFSASLDASLAKQLNEEIIQILDASQQYVDLVIDAEHIAVTNDFLNIREQLTYPAHSQIGHVSIIVSNKLSKLWMLLIHKQCKEPVKFFKSHEEIAQSLKVYFRDLS